MAQQGYSVTYKDNPNFISKKKKAYDTYSAHTESEASEIPDFLISHNNAPIHDSSSLGIIDLNSGSSLTSQIRPNQSHLNQLTKANVGNYNEEVVKLKSDLELEQMVSLQRAGKIGKMKYEKQSKSRESDPKQMTISQLRQDRLDQQNKIIAQTKVIRDLETKLSSLLAGGNNFSQMSHDEFQNLVDISANKIKSLRSELEDTQTRLDQSIIKNKDSEFTIHQLNTTLNQKNQEITQLNLQLTNYTELSTSIDILNRTYQETGRALSEKIKILETDLIQKNREIFDLKLENNNLNIDCKQKGIQNNDLKQALEIAKKNLLELEKRLLENDYDSVKIELAQREKDIQLLKSKYEQKIQMLETETDLEIENLQKRIAELEEINERQKDYMKSMQQHEESDYFKTDILSKNAQIANLEKERKELIKRISEEIRIRDQKIESLTNTLHGYRLKPNGNIDEVRNLLPAKSNVKEVIQRLEDENEMLNTRSMELESNLTRLQEEMKILNNENDELKKLLDAKSKKIYDLESLPPKYHSPKITPINTENDELNVFKKHINDQQLALEEVRKENADLKQQVNQLKIALRGKDSEIESLSHSLSVLSSEKDSLESSIVLLKDELEKASTVIREVENTRIRFGIELKSPCDCLKQMLNMYEMLKVENENRAKEFSASVKKASESAIEHEKVIGTLRKTLEDKSNQMIELSSGLHNSIDFQKYTEGQRIQQRLENDVREKEVQIRNLASRIASLEKNLMEGNNDTQRVMEIHESELNILKGKLEKKKEALDNMKIEVLRIKKESEQKLKESLDIQQRLQKKVSEYELELSEGRNKLVNMQNTAKERIDSLSANEQKLKDELLAVENKLKSLNQDMVIKVQENERLTKYNESLEKKIESISNENKLTVDKLKQQIEDQKRTNKESIKNLTSQLEKKSQQLEVTETKLDNYTNENTKSVEQLLNQNSEFQEQIKQHTQANLKLEKRITKLKTLCQDIQLEKEAAILRVKELKDKLKEERTFREKEKNEIDLMKEKSASSDAVFRNLYKKHSETSSILKSVETERDELKEQIAQYTMKIQKLDDERRIFETEVKMNDEQKVREINSLHNNISELTKQVNEYKEREDTALQTNIRTIEEKVSMEKQMKELQNKLMLFEASLDNAKLEKSRMIDEETHRNVLRQLEEKNKIVEDLSKDIALKDEQIKAAKKHSEIQSNEVQALKRKLEDKNVEIEDIRGQFELTGEDFEKKLEKNILDLQCAKTENISNNKKISEMMLEFTKMKSDYDNLLSQHVNLQKANEELNNEFMKSKHESINKISELQGQLKYEQSNVRRLEKSVSSLEKRLSESDSSSRLFQMQVIETKKNLESSLDKAKNELKMTQDNLNNINIYRDSLQKELNVAKQKLESSVSVDDFDRLVKKYNAIKNAKNIAEKKIASLAAESALAFEQKIEQFVADNNRLIKENDNLKDNIREKETTIKRLQEVIRQSEFNEYKVTKVDYDRLSSEYTELKEQHRALKFSNESVKKENEAMIGSVEKLNKEIESLKDTLKRASMQIDRTSELNTQLSICHGVMTNTMVRNLDSFRSLRIIVESINNVFGAVGLDSVELKVSNKLVLQVIPGFSYRPSLADSSEKASAHELLRKLKALDITVPVISLSQGNNGDVQIDLVLRDCMRYVDGADKTIKSLNDQISHFKMVVDAQSTAVQRLST